jgi:hypothetical protein
MAFWGEMFSGQHVLQWDAVEPGNTLTLPFSVSTPGHCDIIIRLSRNAEGGIFKIYLDEKSWTKELNLYQPPPFPGPFDAVISVKEIQAGEHELKFVYIDSDKESKGTRLHVDKFQVKPVEWKRFLGIFKRRKK